MPRISLIVPVYNAEQYISRCIDSILAQNFSDFELVLINDGSRDNSLEICNHFSGLDARVVVVSQRNGGVSSARNHGIDVSKGDYICFVDADDYVSPSYLEQLVLPTLKDEKIDLVLQGRIKCEGDKQAEIAPDRECMYFLSQDPGFFENVNLFRYCAVYSKLFKRKIVQNHEISFPESLNHGEDFDFFARYLMYCDGVYVSNCANYYYMINDGSLSHRFSNFENEYFCMLHLKDTLSDLSEKFLNHAIDKQIKEFLAYYTARVLSSIYEPPRQDYSLRINHLKSIDVSFVQLYRDYFIPPTMNSKVFKFLFVNKFYHLFDIACLVLRKMHDMSKS